jgi:hypothetical protein
MPNNPKKPRKPYVETPKSRAKRIARQRAWYWSHRKEASVAQRRRRLRAVYGLTPQDFTDMVRQQNGKCFVCHRKPRQPLCIDHCHETGRVRALLCLGCNSMLGFAGDDPIILLSGASYSVERNDRSSSCRCFCRHNPFFAHRISRPSECLRSGAVVASSASI